MKISIVGIATELGKKVELAMEVAERFGRTGDDITASNGVTCLYRFLKPILKPADIVTITAETLMHLLDAKKVGRKAVRGIFGSSNFTHETLMPTFTASVAHASGLRNVICDHVGLGCAGGLQALRNAFNQMCLDARRGRFGYYVVVLGDEVSSIIDPNDFATNIFFSEGTCALLLSNDPDVTGTAYTIELVETMALLGDSFDMIRISNPLVRRGEGIPFLEMNSKRVYRFATAVAEHMEELLKREEVGSLRSSYFIPHQANLRIIEMVAKKAMLNPKFVYQRGIRTVGNLLNASVFFGLVDAVHEGLFDAERQHVVLGAFGAEQQIGVAVLRPSNPENLFV